MSNNNPVSGYKKTAALRAVEYVRDGMVVGLGTGSTAAFAIEALGEKVKQGLKITGIPTSDKSAQLAQLAGIKLSDLEMQPAVDVTIDGADEVERGTLYLIKGLGGALLREKITAAASYKVIIIVDESKISDKLGSKAPLPVEVSRFGWNITAQRLAEVLRGTGSDSGTSGSGVIGSDNSGTVSSGAAPGTAGDTNITVRCTPDGRPFLTDGGNYILDCRFGTIDDAPHLEALLSGVTGVIETGLFINIASEVIVAGTGGVSVLRGTGTTSKGTTVLHQ